MPEQVSLKMVQITRETKQNLSPGVITLSRHVEFSPGSVGMLNFFTGFSNHFVFSPGWSEIRLLSGFSPGSGISTLFPPGRAPGY